MILTEIELTNFRSYPQRSFKFGPGVTVVAGPNSSGKTNLLEALYVLGLMRSFRANDADLIRHGEAHWRVVGRHAEGQVSVAYETGTPGARKRVQHNRVVKPQIQHLGWLPVVLFEPSQLELAAGPPAGRRRYLDAILAQTDAVYLQQLQTYVRALRQRNYLLAAGRGGLARELFAWDLVLAEAAGPIVAARRELVGYLATRADELYAEVAGHAAGVRLAYETSITAADYTSGYLEALERQRPRDLAAGFTTLGPHRENLAVQFKDRLISRVASRGELRTVVMVLKLAELAYIEAKLGRRPLLLLDDVFSELDRQRRRALVRRLQGLQSVITTTDADSVAGELPEVSQIVLTAKAARA